MECGISFFNKKIPAIVDNLLSRDKNKALSAKQGNELAKQVSRLEARGKFLSLWDCSTGLAITNPIESPYVYHTGDYFIVQNTGDTNYRPNGAQYIAGQASITEEIGTVKKGDTYYYDGNNWIIQQDGTVEVGIVIEESQIVNPGEEPLVVELTEEQQCLLNDIPSVVTFSLDWNNKTYCAIKNTDNDDYAKSYVSWNIGLDDTKRCTVFAWAEGMLTFYDLSIDESQFLINFNVTDGSDLTTNEKELLEELYLNREELEKYCVKINATNFDVFIDEDTKAYTDIIFGWFYDEGYLRVSIEDEKWKIDSIKTDLSELDNSISGFLTLETLPKWDGTVEGGAE